MTQASWDERYTSMERVWSGQPNGVLVTEISGLPRGRVLDVGCGEGADAVWLAEHGWDVTALDVSGVALERAARHAAQAQVPVRWVHAVHHQVVDADQARAHGCDPDDYVSPADVAARLDDGWRIEVNETRPRHVADGAGSHHTHDVVLRARRLT